MRTHTRSDTVILGYARTPMGGLMGSLRGLTAPQLGAAAIRAALDRSGAVEVDRVLMGCVLLGGLGQAPARQAALAAGLPEAVPCTAVSKVCGSGMEALILGHALLQAGLARRVVAGGMESMSNAPHLLPDLRGGARLGHRGAVDSLFHDGLEDAYEPGRLMGSFGDRIAAEYGFTRAEQDAFALESLRRALAAQAEHAFARELVGVPSGSAQVEQDEQPGKAKPEKIPTLRPAFSPDGTVTAANASSISDGAAALVLADAADAEAAGLAPLARLVGTASHAGPPARFACAPVPAIRALLEQVGWGVGEVDLFEINEAFALVPMIAMRELGIPHARLNVHGGACALGHPLGASGARIVATLLGALKARGLRRGVASLCIGGGEATALALEIT
ncbi:acetyl-CoA C-acyltransferase [Methylobacterium sp. AMS5]|uniref:acetyl-CoA C-acyltransferase n=1 Tax=Methylobacterium sp. AMS5 TaxID=925818 RepID=UPI00074F9B31|nr:acetyl-CoA C-acyltransferase [Methylobacterium sp. AMS5]AMB47670.1 acetyl-CoA acetyltransferase [Methylobacterium sp. AMS5]